MIIQNFPDNMPVEDQIEVLGNYLMVNFPGEFVGEGAIEMAIRLLERSRRNNTLYNGGIRPTRKETSHMSGKHAVGKFLIANVIGGIITGLLEMAYDKKFKPITK